MTGTVFLVGAGCADRDLITVRGLKCLRKADAVVYDDLLADGLLEEIRPNTACYYVGKRSGKHSVPQEEINGLLIRLARCGSTVCRLKGGDPFVFGRGGEEAMALEAAGIPFEVVPGISSCIAVPELMGIPVTHRKVSRSFHVITAHTADTENGLPSDFERLAGLDGTLVFLMGLSRLKTITQRLIEAGKPADTPAAVAGVGAVGGVIRGSLADLAERAKSFPDPAVIVVGPVAKLDLCGSGERPLSGATVGLTGTKQLREKMRPVLQNLGAEVICIQPSRVEDACTAEELTDCLREGWNWIAFTSPNGVMTFFRLLREGKYDLRCLAGIKFAAIGPGTAAVLERYGLFADLLPEQYDTASLGAALAKNCGGRRVLLACAENASDAPERALREAGIFCQRQSIYRLAAGPLNDRAVDYLVFGSAGGVEQYQKSGGALEQRTAVCIGAVTARKAREFHAARIITAASAAAKSLAEAILFDYQTKEAQVQTGRNGE